MITDAQRRELYASLVGTLGEGPAETMMQLLPPFDWEDVARRTDVADLGVALRDEMGELRTELRSEMSELRIELRGEMAELKGELKGEMGELRGQMGEMRGELRGLGHRLDSQLAKLVVANLGTSAAFAGLVFGAIRLAA